MGANVNGEHIVVKTRNIININIHILDKKYLLIFLIN